MKMFTKRHDSDAISNVYHLKGSDKLETPFSKFVHSHRAALAACIRDCWSEQSLINLLPMDRLLVVVGPDEKAIKLEKGVLPISEDLLESNHIEADTRMMLHMYVVKIDGLQNMVTVQSVE